MRSWLIGVIVFVSSGAVLVLEIVAGRILAPYVGVSLQTFTGIIGTVLAAIALGAWFGGRLADSRDPSTLLGPVLVLGGLLAIVSPAFVTVVGSGVQAEDPATIVILAFVGFFAPAAVLSMVTPIAAKMLIESLDTAGSVVGNLSAIGTAGALFGTFVTGFFLIAAAPSKPITWIVGAILLVLGVVASMKRAKSMVAAATVLGILAFGVSTALAQPCDHETAYSCVRVVTDPLRPSGRVLILDTFVNSYVDVEDSTYLSSRYARVTDAVVEGTLPSGPLDIAYVGGGGYTLPRFYEETRGGSSTVLELDSALLDIAVSELGLVEGPWLTSIFGDARLTLADLDDGAFDVIVGDAFSGRSVPWHLTTKEFLTEVRSKLKPNGLYVMNTIDHPPTRFARAEAATISAVFPYVAVVAPQSYIDSTGGGNFVLVGSNQPIPPLAVAALVTNEELVLTGELARDWFDGSTVLTDEYAPVDQWISRP